MDLPQTILLIAIFVISIILTIIGVQIIMLLRDARETLKKTDHLVSNLEFLSGSFMRTSTGFSHLASGLESGMKMVGLVSSLLTSKSKKK
ncbi:MAG: hypothetical protein ABII80_00910 [bacterium]